jgi:phosphomethylpyrimidine synthase
VKSGALTAEQQEILEKRGVLSPEEIHRLASKTKKAMSDGVTQRRSDAEKDGKASCHSDYVDPETARRMQEEKAGREVIVQVDVRPALGIGKEDRVV